MRIDFNAIEAMRVPGMNGGAGEMSAQMYADPDGMIIPCRIHAGGSIGLHAHPTSDDINYILSGTGRAVCDGEEELYSPASVTSARRGRRTASKIPAATISSC